MPQTPQDSDERLLKAATTLFAKNGYAGTSVKDIADEAGVNVSLVSYHFGGKEGLYRACIEPFAKSRVQSSERFLKPATTLEEFQIRLGLFLEDLIMTHVNNPEVTAIVHRNFDMESPKTDDIFQNLFLRSFSILVEFFSNGQKHKIIDAKLDPRQMAGLTFGSVLQTARMDSVGKKYFGLSITNEEHRRRLIEHAVRAATTGYIPPSHLMTKDQHS